MAAKGAGRVAEGASWVRVADPVEAAGAILSEWLDEVDRERGAARLAIPGGSALAAVPIARDALPDPGTWRRLRLTWVDERCVPLASSDSNRGAAERAGLLDDPAPGDVLPLFLDGEEGAQAAARVDVALGDRFGGALDVILLGMGEDGHVASLFPGLPVPPGRRAAHLATSPKPPPERITLTRPLLATASGTLLLAMGEGKRRALERLKAGDRSLPAHALPGLTVVTDLDLEVEGGDAR